MYNVYVCDSSLRNVITVFEGISELCIILCLNSYCKTHNHNDKRVETKNLKNGVFYICFESLFRSAVLSINALSGTYTFNIILSIILSVCVIRWN